MPGLTGYGSPPDDPKRHTGAAGCGCGDCEAKRKTAAGNQPGTKQPITGTTPMPPTVASTVTGLPQNSVTAPGAAGAAGAPGTVTPINKFAPKNRFDSRVGSATSRATSRCPHGRSASPRFRQPQQDT